MKLVMSLVFLLLWVVNCQAEISSPLNQQIDELIQHRLPNANLGIVVMDADSGELLYQRQAYQAFNPASNMKIFTAAAVLYALGPDFSYQTKIYYALKRSHEGELNGDLAIKFSGDPSLKTSDLNSLLVRLKQQNIHKINGNIRLDDTLYKDPVYAAGTWAQDDINWYYAAPTTAIQLDGNQVSVFLTPNKELGKLAAMQRNEGTEYLQVNSQVKTVTQEQADLFCSLNVESKPDNSLFIYGCVAQAYKPQFLKLAVRNPALYMQKVLARLLAKNHIVLNGKIVQGAVDKDMKMMLAHQSAPMRSLLTEMMKESNNLYADSFIKTLGYNKNGQGSFLAGTVALQEILHKRANLNFDESVIADGSGASAYDLVTPRQIARLLYVINKTPGLGKVFIDTLPISGRDGTLHKRLLAFDLAHKIYAKTGSAGNTGISSLSGYLTKNNGKKLVFSMIVNHNVGDIKNARDMQDQLLEILVG